MKKIKTNSSAANEIIKKVNHLSGQLWKPFTMRFEPIDDSYDEDGKHRALMVVDYGRVNRYILTFDENGTICDMRRYLDCDYIETIEGTNINSLKNYRLTEEGKERLRSNIILSNGIKHGHTLSEDGFASLAAYINLDYNDFDEDEEVWFCNELAKLMSEETGKEYFVDCANGKRFLNIKK